MQKIETEKVKWIDLEMPNADDMLEISREYHLHPLVMEELATPTLRPKAAQYDGCLYLAIHIPLFDVKEKSTFPAEVDIIITKDTLITSHDKDIFQLTEFFKNLKKNEDIRNSIMGEDPGYLLHQLLETLFESCFPKLDHVIEKLDHIEEEIFAGHETEMVFEISVVKRDILNFRRTMKPQKSIIDSLAQREYGIINPELRPYFQDLVGTVIRIWNTLENLKETIESLEGTNNSLLSNKLDMTMKVLTLFSAITLPLSVYSNIMAMSAHIPFATHPHGFWIHISVMFVLAILTIILFRVKKWL